MEADIVKPLLLLDIDGCLNPKPGSNGRRPDGYETHRFNPMTGDGFTDWVTRYRKPLRVWLNPQHGVELIKLTEFYELVWCTTWEHQANDWISPHLGLPELPVIEFGKSPSRPDARIHWKTAKVIEYANGRPFVWVDDEIGQRDHWYIGQHHAGKYGVMPISSRTGLMPDNFMDLKGWHKEWATWMKVKNMSGI